MLDTDQWGHSEIELQIVTTWEDSDEWDSGSDQDTADAPKTADTAPEPPRTPEQPTVAVSRATPTKDAARELLDTRIVPRALWGVAGEGLQQEQALWVVAAHDAAALADALCGALGGQCMAAALLNWGRQTGKLPDPQQSTQQADRDTHAAVHPLSPLPTHAVLMKRYLGLLAPPVQTDAATTQGRQQQPQQQTRQQGRQQDHVRKAADMQQQQQRWMQRRHPQINAHDQQAGQKTPQLFSDRQLWSFLDEAEVASTTMRPFYRDYDEVYLEQMWATLQVAEAKYKTANPRMIRGILQKKHNRMTTLEPNSPRAGDDWAD
jgi:hypothetical protein